MISVPKKPCITFCFILFFTPLAVYSQDDINYSDLIINSNIAENYIGNLTLENNEIFLKSKDCFLSNPILLTNSGNNSFNSKKWIKKLKRNNGLIKNVILKGLLSDDKLKIDVIALGVPLDKSKRWTNNTVSGLYLDSAMSLYKEIINLRENYIVYSIAVEEVEDPELGSVTEYYIFDKNCNSLTREEIKSISQKDLGELNEAILKAGDLIVKQTALLALADKSVEEIKAGNTLEKIALGKDSATAAIYQAAILAELPQIANNLEATRKYIKQLQSE
jgi:hypothetical protein